MGEMLEAIRQGKAPGSILRRAARGELSVPAGEAIAILAVLMADGELRGEAQQTLEAWEEGSLREVAGDAATPAEVLRCLLRTQLRTPGPSPAVIAALCDNPALPAEELQAAVRHSGAEARQAIMRSARVRNSTRLLQLIEENPAMRAGRAPGALDEGPAEVEAAAGPQSQAESFYAAGEMQELLLRYCEGLPVPAPEERPFELVKGSDEEPDPLAHLLEAARQDGPDDQLVDDPAEQQQLSLVQRITRMKVGERIKLAMLGSREERMVLIRDRSKLVALAVLASPKVNESEMEAIAAMKNIQESVLRAIAANRKNMKSYGVIKTLANNPKAPLDVSLPLLVHLLLKDLRSVAASKNVNETLRKRAKRLYQLKSERHES